jgi:hypothetical protein
MKSTLLNITSFLFLLSALGFFQHDELLKGFCVLGLSLLFLIIKKFL